VAAADVALLAEDKPCLIAENIVDDATMNWSVSGDLTQATDNDSDYPVRRLNDRSFATLSQPATTPAAAAYTTYITIQGHSLKAFDTVAIYGLWSELTTPTITVEISDDKPFTTRNDDIQTWTPTADGRLCSFSLDSSVVGGVPAPPHSFSDVDYLRFKLECGAGVKPQVGGVWLGRRRQLPYHPDLPWDPAGQLGGDYIDHETSGGVQTRYANSAGRATFPLRTVLINSTQAAMVRSMWADCNYGVKRLLFVPKPSSEPNKAYLVKGPPQLLLPEIGPYAYSLELAMLESAPYVSAES